MGCYRGKNDCSMIFHGPLWKLDPPAIWFIAFFRAIVSVWLIRRFIGEFDWFMQSGKLMWKTSALLKYPNISVRNKKQVFVICW